MNAPAQNLAVLFAYVSGSKPLLEKLGQAETLYALDRCTRRIARIVISLRGRVVKSEGEEVMALFAATDDAYQAAIEMQQRIADLLPVSGVSLSVRVGFHFGAVEEAAEIAGDAVTTAARLAEMAGDGQILISEQAFDSFSAIQRNNLCRMENRAFPGQLEGFNIHELFWRELPPQASVPVAGKTNRLGFLRKVGLAAAAPSADDREISAATIDTTPALCAVFRHGNRVIAFSDRKGFLTIGRDSNSDIVVTDRKASRNHARIEKRRDQYILVDTSTNGTFVIFKNKQEVLVRQEEMVLDADGELCFGSSPDTEDSEHVIFELPQQQAG